MGAKRGRPRAFDEREALGQILNIFWERGYAQTSLEDLCVATGLNKPSLYAAFGDKKAMYLKGLDAFRGQLLTALDTILFGERDLKRALKRFFKDGIDIYLAGTSGPRGCLAICTATTEATIDDDIRGRLALVINDIDSTLARRLKQAVSDGDLPRDTDPAGMARFLSSILHSLAVRARARAPKAQLASIADTAIETALRR